MLAQAIYEFPDVNITELYKPLAMPHTLSIDIKRDYTMVIKKEVVLDFEIFYSAAIDILYKIISI